MSRFGGWDWDDGLPVFRCTGVESVTWDPVVEPPSTRRWVVLGNRRVNAVIDDSGGVALFDEYEGLRWITGPQGTGATMLDERPLVASTHEIGPTWWATQATDGDVDVRRTVRLPEGEQPWLLVQLELHNRGSRPRTVDVVERWALHPGWLNLRFGTGAAQGTAPPVVHDVRVAGSRLTAVEVREPGATAVFGTPHTVVLEQLVGTGTARASRDGDDLALEVATTVTLAPGTVETRWFRFGLDDGSSCPDPAAEVAAWSAALRDRLPSGTCAALVETERELRWHAALLTGGACRDGVLGGHTLDQGSAYSYHWGFNGAARDPLQHALPLVYTEPDLALSVLRNTCAWAAPDGDLPYGLDGAKQPWTTLFVPSDQNLWALWLAVEYAAATGDLAAFRQPVGFHPVHAAEPVPLEEHLRRQLDFLVHGVGLGEHGHLRIMNADWNDVAIATSGVPREQMVAKGESVLNSAMAAWVLPVYAGLCDRLGDGTTAQRARQLGEQLRQAVAGEWNGRWFRRAYGPGVVVGDDDLWLESQPWAILCGAATDDQAAQLLETIDREPRCGSPLGARVRWPVGGEDGAGLGEATNGGIWFAVNASLVWAAARLDPALAWDEWRRMSLTAHTAAYPDVWEGTVSGPDCYNSPESDRPGSTWALPDLGIGMQTFPVGNLHCHAQPLLAYMRLLGVAPTVDGSLAVTGADPSSGASFRSRTFAVEADGSGRLTALGDVIVDTGTSRITGGAGELSW